ncbi:MAG: aminotransferase class V-fold PLP-dependent enzyme [Geminicoccaceae bacterium]
MSAPSRPPVERGRHFLQLPGPTPVPERVLQAMQRAGNDFTDPAFVAMNESCLADLARMLGTAGDVLAYVANGHGVWEAALVNLLEPGDAVLVPGTGRFSRSWAEMAGLLGIEAIELPADWRRAADPALVEAALAADRAGRIKAVLAVHTETATSTRSDPRLIRRALDATGHGALLVVDTIASLAIEEFAMDAWGVDAALAVSQKGLMLPPGLAFLALGPRALDAARRCRHPRRYWDAPYRLGGETYLRWHGTPPVQMVWGLRTALDMLIEEGLEQAVARHARLAEAVRRCVLAWSAGGAIELNALRPEECCNGVTTLRTGPGIDAKALRVLLRERFAISLGGGLGELEGKALRIGHMGDVNATTMLGVLAGVEAGLRRAGVPLGQGGLDAAIAWIAQSAS